MPRWASARPSSRSGAPSSHLLLRGRMVSVPMAWLGVLSSPLLVVLLPLQFIGVVSGIVTSFLVMWMPALVFELSLAVWLLAKGATPARGATNLQAASPLHCPSSRGLSRVSWSDSTHNMAEHSTGPAHSHVSSSLGSHDSSSSVSLLIRAQHGDEAARNELCARYLPRLRRW